MAIAACSSGGCGSSRANAKTKIDSGILQQHRFKVFKFTFCKYFFKGKCTRGNGCTFAHGVEELRERPQLSKTRICEKWRQGTCEHVNSENCRFAHGKEDLRIAKPGICDLHRQGLCAYGKNCRFAHNEEEVTTQLLLSSATKTPLEVHQAVQGAWNKLRRTTAYQTRQYIRKGGPQEQHSILDISPSVLCTDPGRLQYVPLETDKNGEPFAVEPLDRLVRAGVPRGKLVCGRSAADSRGQADAMDAGEVSVLYTTADPEGVLSRPKTRRLTHVSVSWAARDVPSRHKNNSSRTIPRQVQQRPAISDPSYPLVLPTEAICHTGGVPSETRSSWVLHEGAAADENPHVKGHIQPPKIQVGALENVTGNDVAVAKHPYRSTLRGLDARLVVCPASPHEGSYGGSWSTRTSSDEGIAYSECSNKIQNMAIKSSAEFPTWYQRQSPYGQQREEADESTRVGRWRTTEKLSSLIRTASCAVSNSYAEKEGRGDSRRNSAFGSGVSGTKRILGEFRRRANCTAVPSSHTDTSSTRCIGREDTASPAMNPSRVCVSDSGDTLSDEISSREKSPQASATSYAHELAAARASTFPPDLTQPDGKSSSGRKNDQEIPPRGRPLRLPATSPTGPVPESREIAKEITSAQQREAQEETRTARVRGLRMREESSPDNDVMRSAAMSGVSNLVGKNLANKTRFGGTYKRFLQWQPSTSQALRDSQDSHHGRSRAREADVVSGSQSRERDTSASAAPARLSRFGRSLRRLGKADACAGEDTTRPHVSLGQYLQPPRYGERGTAGFYPHRIRYRYQQRPKPQSPVSRPDSSLDRGDVACIDHSQVAAKAVSIQSALTSQHHLGHTSSTIAKTWLTVRGHPPQFSKGHRHVIKRTSSRVGFDSTPFQCPPLHSPTHCGPAQDADLCTSETTDRCLRISPAIRVRLAEHQHADAGVHNCNGDSTTTTGEIRGLSHPTDCAFTPSVLSFFPDQECCSSAQPVVVMPAFTRRHSSLQRSPPKHPPLHTEQTDAGSSFCSSDEPPNGSYELSTSSDGKDEASTSDGRSTAYSSVPVYRQEFDTSEAPATNKNGHSSEGERQWSADAQNDTNGEQQVCHVTDACSMSAGFLPLPETILTPAEQSHEPGGCDVGGSLPWSMNTIQGRVPYESGPFGPWAVDEASGADPLSLCENSSQVSAAAQTVERTSFHAMLSSLCTHLGRGVVTMLLEAASARVQYTE